MSLSHAPASLVAVISIDPLPDSVEDILNVCPDQAASFGGRHLRLALITSLPDEAQGWPGHEGVVRVRVDTALRPADPAVLIMPGLKAAIRDPVVNVQARAVPPHLVMPWAKVEVVRNFGREGRDERDPGGNEDCGQGFATSKLASRPEAVLEILRGSVIKANRVAHFRITPMDAICQGARLLCQRAPEYIIPRRHVVCASINGKNGGNGDVFVDRESSNDKRGKYHGGTASASESQQQQHEGREGARGGPRDAATVRRDGRLRDGRPKDGRGDSFPNVGGSGSKGSLPANACRGHSSPLSRQAAVDLPKEYAQRNEAGQENVDQSSEGADGWFHRLAEWGLVTKRSEIVLPHEALEVRYHDAAAVTTHFEEPDWVDTVLQSHDPSVVDDISAGLGLAVPSPSPPKDTSGCFTIDSSVEGSGRNEEIPEDDIHGKGGNAVVGGSGALLVHGPPGVGKTLLVEALGTRLRCRLVKISPGSLAASAGVQADRILAEAFGYCRQCVSPRVVLLLDSIDRLIPASEGNVGASRGEVDAGVLNAFVLAVEQGRADSRWQDRVAVVGVSSWPDQVHPTARRCAGQEAVVLPPSEPLRASILRRALRVGGRSGAWKAAEDRQTSEAQEAFKEVVGLCQGFTAGDMCAIAATALNSWTPPITSSRRTDGRTGKEIDAATASRGEGLRAAFRQVRRGESGPLVLLFAGATACVGRCARYRIEPLKKVRLRIGARRGGGGAGDGGLSSVSGVPSVRWSEVGGLERAKQAVREMVVWPARYPETFLRMGITPASGVLLFGPPGTGKTLLAKAAATETGATFIELKISDVVRGEIGESEKAIDRAFRTARELAPSIVFIDEFQALFASRDVEGGTGSRLASQLLVCMDELVRWRAAGAGNPADFGRKEQDDETIPSASSARNRDVGNDGNDQDDNNASSCLGMEGGNDFSRGALRSGGANVMVLAATNAPDAVDAAFLRPGRFDEIVYAGLPDTEGRQHILRAAKARMEGAVVTAASSPTFTSISTPTSARTSRTRSAAEGTPACVADMHKESGPFASATIGDSTTLDLVDHRRTCADDGTSDGGSGGGGDKGDNGVMHARGKWACDVDTAWLSQQTEGFSGADLSSLMRNAAMAALREQEGVEKWDGEGRWAGTNNASGEKPGTEGTENLLILSRRHFCAAIASTQPSSGPDAVAKHERWARQWRVA